MRPGRVLLFPCFWGGKSDPGFTRWRFRAGAANDDQDGRWIWTPDLSIRFAIREWHSIVTVEFWPRLVRGEDAV